MNEVYVVMNEDAEPCFVAFSYEGAEVLVQRLIKTIGIYCQIVPVKSESLGAHAIRYIHKAKKVMPSLRDAQDWMITEMGEMVDARLSLNKEWVRNNPEKHKNSSVDEEIADVVLMAALATDQDVLEIMNEKMKRKGWDPADPISPNG